MRIGLFVTGVDIARTVGIPFDIIVVLVYRKRAQGEGCLLLMHMFCALNLKPYYSNAMKYCDEDVRPTEKPRLSNFVLLGGSSCSSSSPATPSSASWS